MKNKLPIGWKELPPTGHPLDKGTPEEEWDNVANPRKPRQEIKLWFRGNRYVRICKQEDDKYSLHRGLLDNEDSDKITCYNYDELSNIEIQARTLMRIGGY